MYPLLRSSPARCLALVGLVIICALASLKVTVGASPKITATAAPNARAIALTVEAADEPQVSVAAAKNDRLPLPPLSSAEPPSPPAAEPSGKPAEPIAYVQAEPEQVRRAHAEVLDLCQRHGMHKHYFNVGRRQSWKCER